VQRPSVAFLLLEHFNRVHALERHVERRIAGGRIAGGRIAGERQQTRGVR
jgi:hypothetical protein